MTVTTSQVNKAGRTLRSWMTTSELPFFGEAEQRAMDVLVEFRASHATPLIKANNGLRSMVRTEGCDVQVSQRLKRVTTILDKLTRHPTMALASMQDIGGCRAILADIAGLRRVERHVTRVRPPVRADDYVASPRQSGYRAVHMIVRYDDRCVEIQLRTKLMHEWAVAVERFGGRIAEDLKSGEGPEPVLAWLAAVADALAAEDRGEAVPPALVARIDGLRTGAIPYLRGGAV